MAKLTPKIELIKAKYKGRTDQATMQKQQQEIMEFQQKEGYNPLSGCLPLLLLFPIIIFLYDIIRNPLSYIGRFTDAEITQIKDAISSTATTEFALLTEIINSGVDLGGGLRKVRMAIKSKGRGKSHGARVITYLLLVSEDEGEINLLTIYDKAERESISREEIEEILLGVFL